MPLELRHYSDLSCHIRVTKRYLLFEFLTKWQNWKAQSLFHTRSNLLCLVCRHVVSFLFAPGCIFHCVRTWCVVWERHGLLDTATVTKGGRSLWRVNCLNFTAFYFFVDLNILQNIIFCHIYLPYHLVFTKESKWTGHMAHVRTGDLNYTLIYPAQTRRLHQTCLAP